MFIKNVYIFDSFICLHICINEVEAVLNCIGPGLVALKCIGGGQVTAGDHIRSHLIPTYSMLLRKNLRNP